MSDLPFKLNRYSPLFLWQRLCYYTNICWTLETLSEGWSFSLYFCIQSKRSNICHAVDGEKHPDFFLLLLRLWSWLENWSSASVTKPTNLDRLQDWHFCNLKSTSMIGIEAAMLRSYRDGVEKQEGVWPSWPTWTSSGWVGSWMLPPRGRGAGAGGSSPPLYT